MLLVVAHVALVAHAARVAPVALGLVALVARVAVALVALVAQVAVALVALALVARSRCSCSVSLFTAAGPPSLCPTCQRL